MCMGKATTVRGFCVVPPKECRGLERVRSMRQRIRNRRILVYRSEWKNGGTVEPPCDFQKEFSKMPVNRGIPP